MQENIFAQQKPKGIVWLNLEVYFFFFIYFVLVMNHSSAFNRVVSFFFRKIMKRGIDGMQSSDKRIPDNE